MPSELAAAPARTGQAHAQHAVGSGSAAAPSASSSSSAPSSAGPRQAASTRNLNRLARGNAAHALRSRASLESDGMVSNSDDSASFGTIQLPRRQPVFTAPAGTAATAQHQTQQQQRHPHAHEQHLATTVEQQQRQSSGSSRRGPPAPNDSPSHHVFRGAKLLNVNNPASDRQHQSHNNSNGRPSSRMSNVSNSSFNNFDSPKPRQLAKLVSEAAPARSSPPQTPRTSQALAPGMNPDGSHSVIRNDDDANNSGLLDLSPVLTRLGKRPSKAAVLGTPGSIKYATPTHLPTRLGRPDFRLPADAARSALRDAASMKAEAATGMVDDEAIKQADESILDPQYRDAAAAASFAAGNHVPAQDSGRAANVDRGAGFDDDADADADADADEYAEDEDFDPDFSETLNRLRRWRHDAMQQHLYETAIFWGDKILSLETSTAAYNDAYHLAQCYFYTHQYARAEHLLTNPLRTGASRHAAAQLARSRAEFDQAKLASAGAPSAPLASEAGEEGDALLDALAATRSQTQLPASILARSSTKGSVYSASTGGKRKERGFTTSATGSASSDNESASGIDDEAHGGRIPNGRARGTGLRGSGKAGNNAARSGGTSTGSASGSDGMDADGDPEVVDANGSVVIRPLRRSRAGNGKARAARQAGARDEEEAEAELDEIDADLIEVKDKEAPPPDGPSLVNHSLACRYLAAQCQVRLGKYHEALDLVGDSSQWAGAAGNKRPSSDGGIKLGSTVAFLRGQIYLRLEDLARARDSFMAALALDVKNYEAFSALIDGNMLGVDQQWSFVQGLEYLAQAGDDEGAAEDFEFIRLVYTTRLSKQGKTYALNTAAARRRLASEYGLSNNPDVLLGLAEELFSRLRFADAFTVTSRILELAADHPGALPIHIACIYHLKNLRPTLFMLAHRLTELDPESPISWYAVGTWYATTRRWADARRYFSKASLLDPRFAPSWIAFGHTFAMEGESDQAITAYSTASRLFPQSHLPRLFIGMEHLHQGNISLARLSLEGSAQIWDDDPLTANERGVVAYQANDLPTAISFFRQALRLAEKTQEPASAWMGTHLNLGLAYRRADADEEARKSLLIVTELDPHCYLAKLTLGMVAHKLGDLEDAIGWYHEALSINPRDQYGTDLLDFALEEKISSGIATFTESLDPENRLARSRAAADGGDGTPTDGATMSTSSPSKGKARHLSPRDTTPYRGTAAPYGDQAGTTDPRLGPMATPQIRFDSPSLSRSASQSHVARTPGAANRTRQIGELTTAEMSLDMSSASSSVYRGGDASIAAPRAAADQGYGDGGLDGDGDGDGDDDGDRDHDRDEVGGGEVSMDTNAEPSGYGETSAMDEESFE